MGFEGFVDVSAICALCMYVRFAMCVQSGGCYEMCYEMCYVI